MLKFDMDENRTYLSVTIPVHSYFLDRGEKSGKKVAYEKGIVDVLQDNPLTMTELSYALGYKGITKKLTTAVDDMIQRGIIERIAGEGSTNKLRVK